MGRNTKMTKAEEIMEDVLATFAVLIEDHFDNIDPFKIVWQTNTKEFSNNDQEKFGLVMIDFHLYYGIEIEYEPYTEFETFPTLQHAWNHVVDRVLIREGFDPKKV